MKLKVKSGPHSLAHMATRLFNVPLFAEPSKIQTILSVLGPRLGLVAYDDYDDDIEPAEPQSAYSVDADGIVCWPIHGTLVKRAGGMMAMSGLTSYESIAATAEDLAEDDTVKGVLIDLDSFGGEAPGMMAACEAIYKLRQAKPVVAFVNDFAYSAGYGIASACSKIVATLPGGVGSIGCYLVHLDETAADAKEGLKYTIFRAGKYKAEGMSIEGLTDHAAQSFQAEADRQRMLFAGMVARYRNVDIQTLLDTEAQCYHGTDAVPLLADAIGDGDDAMGLLRTLMGLPAATDTDEEQSEPGMENDGMGMPIAADVEQPMYRGYGQWAKQCGHDMEPRRKSLAAELGGPVISCVVGPSLPLVRSAASDNSRRISMLVVPYGKPSSDLGGFREVYQPGCFRDGLSGDPRALFNHDSGCVLGRKSAGTATWWEDAEGLHVDCDAPEATWANDLLVSMRRGDITGASAAFFIVGHRWEYRDGVKTRIVEKAIMHESSVASFPAYETTSAAVVPVSAETEPQPAAAPVAPEYILQHEQLGARLRLLQVQ